MYLFTLIQAEFQHFFFKWKTKKKKMFQISVIDQFNNVYKLKLKKKLFNKIKYIIIYYIQNEHFIYFNIILWILSCFDNTFITFRTPAESDVYELSLLTRNSYIHIKHWQIKCNENINKQNVFVYNKCMIWQKLKMSSLFHWMYEFENEPGLTSFYDFRM